MALGRVVLPIVLVLALGAGAMAVYFHRVTGDPLRMPYLVYQEGYSRLPPFLWQSPRPEPEYRHAVMRDFHLNWEFDFYQLHDSAAGALLMTAGKVLLLGGFYLGVALAVPLVALRYGRLDAWTRFALLASAVALAGLLLETWVCPHYAAPAAGLFYLVVVQGVRRLRLWRWHGRPAGQFLVRGVPLVLAVLVGLSLYLSPHEDPDSWHLQRARIQAGLRNDGARHLILVRYGAGHETYGEWVYNEADIDGAAVVWARALDDEQDRRLLAYYADRTAWLLEADARPARLVPYRAEPPYPPPGEAAGVAGQGPGKEAGTCPGTP